MKILGIDFGEKRVGIAIGSEEAGLAFPKAVLPNDKFLFSSIKEIIKAENIEKIIIGESKNLSGEKNKIMDCIEAFKRLLETDLQIPISYEPEFYTSLQATRIQGENDMIDASAAAIILQSYLDKSKNNK